MTQGFETLKKSADPTVAIAFGGGGARGLAHIHVIETLNELGIRPVAIAGSSIGAIMGAGMAAGLTGADIRDHTLATVGRRKEIVNRLWSLRPSSFTQAVAGGFRFGQFNLERILPAFLPEAIPKDFGELGIPLQIAVTDYYGQAEHVCQSGDLHQALAASAAIPAMFMPVRINGRVMIDGGIYNPVPFDHLMGRADIVIGVDVVGGPDGDGETMPSRIDSLFGASQLMMQSIIAMKVKAHPPHILLRPEVNRFRVMDFLKAQEVLTATVAVKDQLKTALDAAFSARARG
ncbi:Patatin [Rhizobium sp. Root73]|uniref:patatin-like phospholipase family protein n=1 Tax=unclassified Rhizobium TaxID=2613769 RepID=UPI000712310A|nr:MULTISPECIES: patatin-like phospholipase family protein [unclassified Rhizobium]KQV34098.1 Patatin [Rhizobium sp. Root1204]KQY17604.1 Patatin [Rhizobium sp. Root1334]KRC13479.1 Patatin [Rhizobium sp. Root73]